MIEISMNGAGGQESGDMEFALVFLGMIGGLDECRICKKITSLDRFIYPAQVLENYPAGAEGQVANFAIAGFAPSKSDGFAGSLKKQGGVIGFDKIQIWRPRG